MKPYAGGRLPKPSKKTKIADYMRGGKKVEFNVLSSLTSNKCLAYVLVNPVSAALSQVHPISKRYRTL